MKKTWEGIFSKLNEIHLGLHCNMPNCQSDLTVAVIDFLNFERIPSTTVL